MYKNLTAFVGTLALTAFSVVACSDSPARLSPTAPTATSAAIAGATTTAGPMVADRTQGYVRDRHAVAEWAAQSGWTMADGLVVEGTAVITAVSGGPCPNAVITLLGVPVAVNSGTTFGSGISCAGLTTGTTVHVIGLLTFNANSFTVVATNISLPNGGTDDDHEVTGVVASLIGTCPSLTITLAGNGGVVKTSPATTFDPADACTSIAVGTMIEAEGTRNAGGQLEATKLELEDGDTPGGGHGRGRRVGGEGTIGHVTGTCPTLTMVVRGFTVKTTAATTFEGGTCSSIRPGTKAFIEGATQDDGSLRATRLQILAHGHDDDQDDQ